MFAKGGMGNLSISGNSSGAAYAENIIRLRTQLFRYIWLGEL